MDTTKGRLLNQISESLSTYVVSLQLNNSINRLNQNIDGEDLICELLNLVFGWKLKNLNKRSQNYPGIDLGDFENRICVQVTSDKKRGKIEKTLSIVEEKEYYRDFDRIIFIYLSSQRPKFKKRFVSEKICFDEAYDCFSMQEIFREINNLSVKKIEEIGQFLELALVSDITGANVEEKASSVELEEEHVKKICIAKLKSLGLDELVAWDILTNTVIDSRLYVDDHSDNLRFLIGGFGSGKSHQLYCLFLKLLSDYKHDDANMFCPVFMEAKNIKKGKLNSLVSSFISLKAKKLYLLVDGLDEMPLDNAVNLIDELDIIVNSYDAVKALVSSRPLTILHDRNQINARSLSCTEINDLYCRINNVSRSNIEYRFGNNKKAVLNTLAKPFCAVVFCLYAKRNRIFNEMEFVRLFIEKTVGKVLIKNPECESIIKKLAIKAVDYSYGKIDKSEVDAFCDLNTLLGTGLFIEDGRTLTFALPVTAQWLAAIAIRERYIHIDDILADEERMLKWIYPFAMLFNQITFAESKDFFVKLMKKAPGIATLIVRAGEDLTAGTVIENKRINGEQLYYALSSWLKVFDFGNNLYVKNGILNTITYNQNGAYITYGIRRNNIGINVEVKNINLYNSGGEYIYVRSCGINSQSTWPWIESLNFITDVIIEKGIKDRKFILEDSILEDEYIWDSSLKLLRINPFVTSTIEVNKMVDYLGRLHECDVITGPGIGTIDYRRISKCIDKLKKQGKELIECPYYLGSQQLGGYIWSQYTDDEMKKYVEDVYEKALNVYRNFIDTCFFSLKNQMGFYQLLPARMEGYFEFDSKSTWGPSIMWGVIPYEDEGKSTVSLKCGQTRDLTSFSEEMYNRRLRNARSRVITAFFLLQN